MIDAHYYKGTLGGITLRPRNAYIATGLLHVISFYRFNRCSVIAREMEAASALTLAKQKVMAEGAIFVSCISLR